MGKRKAKDLKPIIRKLRSRLKEADMLAGSAEQSVKLEKDHDRALNQLEDIQNLLRDARYLTGAALVMKYPDSPMEHID
ncbi:MAG: hypothetical protein H6874_01440 [Hyphomicrobiaceae bacterium]|nr:hypothetical protein [Hyphomicrobiaceae bacterium]